ncbi:MAG: outer membrane beta-barrel protein, partial [Prevotella sp.]|nr:outer membrane beta-barrel protein [Prevotella sp.]
MTNFTTYGNGGYNEITGNPHLRPSFHYQLQLVYVLRSKYQFVSWFSHHDNYFVQTPYQRHDRLTVSYRNLNFDFMRQVGFQAAIPLKPSAWLESRLTLTGVWQHEKNSHFYDIPFNRSIVFGMARISNAFTIAKRPDIVLSVDGHIRSKAIQSIYDLPSSGGLDLSVRWQFWSKRAVLRLYCNDLFETSGINPAIDFKGQNMRM